jgi:hypothetical protein
MRCGGTTVKRVLSENMNSVMQEIVCFGADRDRVDINETAGCDRQARRCGAGGRRPGWILRCAQKDKQ